MWPVATDVAWVWSVCLLVTMVNCTKMAEPVEVPFGVWTQVGPVKHVLGGFPDPPLEGPTLGISHSPL